MEELEKRRTKFQFNGANYEIRVFKALKNDEEEYDIRLFKDSKHLSEYSCSVKFMVNYDFKQKFGYDAVTTLINDIKSQIENPKK